MTDQLRAEEVGPRLCADRPEDDVLAAGLDRDRRRLPGEQLGQLADPRADGVDLAGHPREHECGGAVLAAQRR
jgi:hypothetical protein